MTYNDYPKYIEVQFHHNCNSYCLICPYKDMNYKYEKEHPEYKSKSNEVEK